MANVEVVVVRFGHLLDLLEVPLKELDVLVSLIRVRTWIFLWDKGIVREIFSARALVAEVELINTPL